MSVVKWCELGDKSTGNIPYVTSVRARDRVPSRASRCRAFRIPTQQQPPVIEYAMGLLLDARRGPAATQFTCIFKSDEPEEDGDAAGTLPCRIDGADSAAGPNGRSCHSECSRPPFGGTGDVRRSCCLCSDREDHAGQAPLPSPCACANLFVHRYCMQNRLDRYRAHDPRPSCKAPYPAQRSTKPIWKWFWEEESRYLALVFAATVVFTVGTVGAMEMARMYRLFEFHSAVRASRGSIITSALLVITVF
ncbi:hypothetical protein HPB48_002713 [Haemaphysalis longicornis]|uniref:RING-CH-type domain-containing protein n=1 Tax=Haemaphysalis longicornis TaxID=44386 RepID=A0A9J6G054_HAELO|nr:hypothetical protein HPB48_002713 [Haemaphysalis longicornis]